MAKLQPFDVPWKVRDGIVVFLMAWIGLPLAIQLALMVVGQYSSVIHTWDVALGNGNIVASFIMAALNAACGLGLVWLYLRRYHAGWVDVGLRRFKLWQAALLIAAIYAAFIILVAAAFALISALVPAFNANQAQTNEFTSPTSAGTRYLSLIALVIIPPIIEEIVFRGFLFAALTKRVGVVLGAVISSALFAFAHLQFNVSIYTFVLGLLLCFMYYRLRSIWPGIFFHALNNYIAFLAIMKK
jgi:membrane protease YdiL (CAAX protease family)